MQWHEELVWAPHSMRCWQNDEKKNRFNTKRSGLNWSDARCPGLIYLNVLLHGGLRAARSINTTLVLHRNAALNVFVLLYKINWSREAAPSKPFWSINHQARLCQGGWASWQELLSDLYHERPQPAIALLRSAEFPPFSQADYIHVVFSLAEAPRGPVLWKWFVEPR